MLRSRTLNGWPLFWLASLPLSLVMVVKTLGYDLSRPEDVSEMIGYSVRWAVPILHLVVATSALLKLFPSPLTRWLMRNRKFIGLTFAVAMAWQALFIGILSVFHSAYYYEEVYDLVDEMHGSVGYIFLAAMVVTSFALGRKTINGKQWRVIHLCALYFLWAYTMSVYWYALFYYEDPELHDLIFYVTGWTAFALRVFAWGKTRKQKALRSTPDTLVSQPMRFMGVALIVAGIVLALTGQVWGRPVLDALLAPAWSGGGLSNWVPYWPYVDFYSLFVLGIGTWMFTAYRSEQEVGLSASTAA